MHNTPFTYCHIHDENRVGDGISLRYRFAITNDYQDVPEELEDLPCSVLEVMVSLAIRAEEWMDDTAYGDRTSQWFWRMVTNLGLGSMTDDKYEKSFVDNSIKTFLNREYEPDGRGGLFTIRNCEYDLRDVSIWHQFCWYLDTIM